MAQVGLLEDNTRIAKLCATMLQYAGHHVIVYEHPRECLDALLPEMAGSSAVAYHSIASRSLSPLPVDVLILDLHLPDMTGIDVLRFLRANPRTRSLPLIFCTAATSSEVANALSIAPQACFIEKPFTFQELISAISSALSRHEN
ncbi:response regulator [Dictyobacter formicarum]|uniref:Response regulator n=1 Tax=Dictyobacter formicarum TaxID=2778368 RepID=A0ABQ3VAZ4_9CHLR|nr:response regulator [Dictyobacter formicarum]GHO82866.1 response regulator [Dictyobacter formicarum]